MARTDRPGIKDRTSRLQRIITLLRDGPLPAELLAIRLNQVLAKAHQAEVSLRTLQLDLDWMIGHLGEAGIERVARSAITPDPQVAAHFRVFYRVRSGEDLIPIDAELAFITELEAIALVAAKAMLASPAPAGLRQDRANQGPLSDALGGLIRRLGLETGKGAGRIPDLLAVTQAPPHAWNANHLLTILRAIRLGDGLCFDYRPLNKAPHPVEVQPIRLILAEGEPYLRAYDGAAQKLKNYKVARIDAIARRDRLPAVPTGLDAQVRGEIEKGFRGVVGEHQRGRVIVRIDACTVPHLRDRRLGSAQVWTDLPDGGARVEFNTWGMDGLKHWLLQAGSGITVESPDRLVAWFAEETAAMAARYRKG